MLNNITTASPISRPAAPIYGAPVAAPAETGPREQVTLGQSAPAAPAPVWKSVQTNNGMQVSVVRDQANQANQQVVATLLPGPLVPAGLKIEWNASGFAQASLTDKPDQKLPTNIVDGQVFVQMEPAGGNPNAPMLVFEPQQLFHGLADAALPDGQGGLRRATQEYQNADGSYLLVADEHKAANGAHTYTRIDAVNGQLKAVDGSESAAQQANLGNQMAMAYLTGGLSLFMGQGQGAQHKETPVQVQPQADGSLQIAHPPAGGTSSLPSYGQIRDGVSQVADQAAGAATRVTNRISAGLGNLGLGWMKERFDYGMSGGDLAKKGWNVGQGIFQHKAAAPAAPAAPPPLPTMSTVHPFSATVAASPGSLFPGLMAALHG